MADPDSGDLLLVAAGDEAALGRILSRWRTPVYGFFERTREPSAATEAAVDLFLRLQRSSARYAVQTPFPVFLWGLAVRILQDEPSAAVASIPPQRLAESAAARTALLRSAVSGLPPGERVAFLLTRAARLPLATAAAAAGVAEEELRRRLVKALEALRTSMKPLLDLPHLAAPTVPESTLRLGETPPHDV